MPLVNHLPLRRGGVSHRKVARRRGCRFAPIAVYDLAGREVAAAKATNGKASLNVSQLNGVYVVKVGDKVVKMIFK